MKWPTSELRSAITRSATRLDPLGTNGIPLYYATCGTNHNIGCYSGVQQNQETGTSNYDALVGRVEKRFSSGFSAAVNYTWSKCLGTPYQDEFTWHVDMHLDYSHCTEDINRIFTANGIYELPFGRGKMFANSGTLADAVVGGWKFAGIATLRTGPWTTLGSQQNIGFFDGALPNLIGPVNSHSLHGGLGRNGRLGPYINTQNVVNLSAVGVQGDSGTHTVENPGYQDYDVSGYKSWKFGDQPSLTSGQTFSMSSIESTSDPSAPTTLPAISAMFRVHTPRGKFSSACGSASDPTA